MSASTPTDGWAFADRWDSHVADAWFARSETPLRDPRGAFDQAVEVHYPPGYDGDTAYYDLEGNVVFLEFDGKVRTCIPLADRSEALQEYIKSQVNER